MLNINTKSFENAPHPMWLIVNITMRYFGVFCKDLFKAVLI